MAKLTPILLRALAWARPGVLGSERQRQPWGVTYFFPLPGGNSLTDLLDLGPMTRRTKADLAAVGGGPELVRHPDELGE
jgi:hypothetical protein